MKLSKKTIVYRGISNTGGVLVFLLFGGIFNPLILFLGFIPLSLVAFGYMYVYWKNYDIFFEDHDIKIVSGVFSKKDLDIPVRRIQNINIKENILLRILEISEVHIETAGGSETEATIKFLEKEDAEKLREKIRNLKSRRKKETEEEAQKDEEEYALTFKKLLVYSLIDSISIKLLLPLLIFIGGFIFANYYLEVFLHIIGAFFGLLVIALLILGLEMISTGVKVFENYYGFKVVRKNDSLEYEKGLFNRQGGTVPIEKLQKLVIEENIVERILGYATLKVETAGASIAEKVSTTKVIVPLDKKEEVIKTAEKIGEFEYPVKMEEVAERAEERYFRRYLLIGLTVFLILVPFALTILNPMVFLIPLTIAMISKKASNLKWINQRYFLGEENIFVRKGFWRRRTYAVPYFRFQNFIESQTVLQKRWDLSKITVDTAGDLWINPEIIDLDKESSGELIQELFDRFNRSICN